MFFCTNGLFIRSSDDWFDEDERTLKFWIISCAWVLQRSCNDLKAYWTKSLRIFLNSSSSISLIVDCCCSRVECDVNLLAGAYSSKFFYVPRKPVKSKLVIACEIVSCVALTFKANLFRHKPRFSIYLRNLQAGQRTSRNIDIWKTTIGFIKSVP
jgi:hypothetical protein